MENNNGSYKFRRPPNFGIDPRLRVYSEIIAAVRLMVDPPPGKAYTLTADEIEYYRIVQEDGPLELTDEVLKQIEEEVRTMYDDPNVDQSLDPEMEAALERELIEHQNEKNKDTNTIDSNEESLEDMIRKRFESLKQIGNDKEGSDES